MDPTTLVALVASAEPYEDGKRVSFEPLDGYVLNPWSGLYQETDATYVNRLSVETA
ncbi:hypothetical protein [Dyella psychrodurans]|uniref:hypothetical protein n=1 Tax=Dyella psychrodurans TaxID=1927960 RepID=UPI001314E4DE|nr:hypothetical protein [Dyella psychrodurans]